MIQRINSQRGIAQFLVIAAMAFFALGIPTATKLVQQNQENRSRATTETNTELSNTKLKPQCGVTTQEYNENTPKEKLCLIGEPSEVSINKTTGEAVWSCKIGDLKIKCPIPGKPVGELTNIQGSSLKPQCGVTTQEYNENTPKEKLCLIGEPSEVSINKTTGEAVWSCKIGDLKIKCPIPGKPVGELTNIVEEYQKPICGPAHGQILTKYPTEKLELCTTGTPSNVSMNRTTSVYTWSCTLNNTKIPCSSKSDEIISINKIDGSCGSLTYSNLTSKVIETDPNLTSKKITISDSRLCKTGKVSDFKVLTAMCIDTEATSKCSQTYYTWKCVGINGGKTVKCTKKNPAPVTSSSISVSPQRLTMKIGQRQNLTYKLSPLKSDDLVKWSTSGTGQVKIDKISLRCGEGAKCLNAPGNNHLQITAVKPGTVKIILTTSSGKKTQATVIVTK